MELSPSAFLIYNSGKEAHNANADKLSRQAQTEKEGRSITDQDNMMN